MGCDIHSSVEIKVNGKWKKSNIELEEYRNYYWFSILADVRNDYEIEPITSDRGIPEDASEDTKKLVDDWGPDGHSHTYLTSKEWSEAWRRYSDLLEKENHDEETRNIIKIAELATNKSVSYKAKVLGNKHDLPEFDFLTKDNLEVDDDLNIIKINEENAEDIRFIVFFDN